MKEVVMLKDVESGNIIGFYDSQETAMLAKKAITSVIEVPFEIDTDVYKVYEVGDKEEFERVAKKLYSALSNAKTCENN